MNRQIKYALCSITIDKDLRIYCRNIDVVASTATFEPVHLIVVGELLLHALRGIAYFDEFAVVLCAKVAAKSGHLRFGGTQRFLATLEFNETLLQLLHHNHVLFDLWNARAD